MAPGTEQMYWEHVLMNQIENLEIYINKQPEDQVYEFENLEELRKFDPKYQNQSNNRAMELVADVFQVQESEIQGIQCLKSGMTNKSFLFSAAGKRYICRIPGPGTELLISRSQEAAVYEAVKPLDVTEHVLYFNKENGYKIAEFYEGARNADPENRTDMARCMELLKQIHQSDLTVAHRFDIRERIGFYEDLCQSHGGIPFEDYPQIKRQMTELMDGLDHLDRPRALSHIDSVADNFLFLPDGNIRLIDWEYAGMCDPFIDVAMCCIYSYYNEDQSDWLTEAYLGRTPDSQELAVVYSYMALGGFLWTLWAVYWPLRAIFMGISIRRLAPIPMIPSLVTAKASSTTTTQRITAFGSAIRTAAWSASSTMPTAISSKRFSPRTMTRPQMTAPDIPMNTTKSTG